MQLKSQLTGMRLFDELAKAGVVADASAVNRVVIDARRGGPVVIHVELVTDIGVLKVIRDGPLLDGLEHPADPEQP